MSLNPAEGPPFRRIDAVFLLLRGLGEVVIFPTSASPRVFLRLVFPEIFVTEKDAVTAESRTVPVTTEKIRSVLTLFSFTHRFSTDSSS